MDIYDTHSHRRNTNEMILHASMSKYVSQESNVHLLPRDVNIHRRWNGGEVDTDMYDISVRND